MLAVLFVACSSDPAPTGDAPKPGSDPAPDKPSAQPTSTEPLGQLQASAAIDLRTILNKTPAEVDAALGEPTDTGSDRVSCVRFVPERVFFACEQEIRLYSHPSFESIRVEFEDGYAATVALAGLPGEGAFDPTAALAAVGLELPREPKHDNPPLSTAAADTVDRWEWGNSEARLLVDGLEQRVRLTVVNGEWRRSKLELINNDPLSPEQRARIKQPKLPPAGE